MKNKYFEELKDMGFSEDFDDWSDEKFEPVPKEQDDPSVVENTVKRVLLLIVFLTVLEEILIFLLIGGIVPKFSLTKWSCMLGLFLGSGIGALMFYLMKLQIVRLSEADPEDRSVRWKLKFGAIGRILLVAGAAAGALFIPAVHPVALLVGVLNLKISVLLYPVLDRKGKNV